MPEDRATASTEPVAVAPDGIAIHGFALPAAWLMSVVEGRIPSGRHGIHRHLTLEQFTYVVEGALTAITNGTATDLRAGDLLLTAPGESLQFINAGDTTARVLFICAPPYPPDDADTLTLVEHVPPSAAERAATRQRLEVLRAGLLGAIDVRLEELK